MPLVKTGMINNQIFTATPQPKMGDREDFSLRVQGPDPTTDFQVPLSITGTALAIWGHPNPIDAAEALGAAIFHQVGTASQPPQEGYWFDSYNSGDNLQDTISKIFNSDTTLFIKNASGALYLVSLGGDINRKIRELDQTYAQKFGEAFFHSLEDLSEESQRVGDLDSPSRDNANYLYRVSILSGIIDHIDVRLQPEDEHECTECHQRHRPSEGSLQALRRWFVSKINQPEADRLTRTFQMIKNLRKQYPIHDHYTMANNVRQVRQEITTANTYFGIRDNEYEHNANMVTSKFRETLDELKTAIENL